MSQHNCYTVSTDDSAVEISSAARLSNVNRSNTRGINNSMVDENSMGDTNNIDKHGGGKVLCYQVSLTFIYLLVWICNVSFCTSLSFFIKG